MNQPYSQLGPVANHSYADEVKKQFVYAKTLEEWRVVLEAWYA